MSLYFATSSWCAPMREKNLPRPHGFTLVELMIVLVVMALLSASAVTMVRQPLANARRQQSISRVRSLDALARERARQESKVRLVFDPQRNTARLIDAQDREIGSPLQLLGNDRFLSLLGTKNGSGPSRSVGYGRFGTSASFAVQLGSEPRQSEWLLVLGMTGQSYVINDEETVRAILKP